MHENWVCVHKSMHVIFLFAFSSRYAKNLTSKFCKVVQQHTKGMVESYYMDFIGNLLLFPAVKNFENPLRIDKFIAMSLMYYFFGIQCIIT